jgi:hypothetical protein
LVLSPGATHHLLKSSPNPTSIANQVMNKMCIINNLKTLLLDKPLYLIDEYFNLYTWDEDVLMMSLNGIYIITVSFIKLYLSHMSLL